MAFNLVLVDYDGSIKLKTIRGFDSNSAEFYSNLKSFLCRNNPNDLAHMISCMRSDKVITILKGGVLVETPVIDQHSIKSKSYDDTFVDYVGDLYTEVETETMNGLYSLEHTIVYRADTGMYYSAPYFDMDSTTGEIVGMNLLEDINNIFEYANVHLYPEYEEETPDVTLFPLTNANDVKEIEDHYKEQIKQYFPEEDYSGLDDMFGSEN